MRRSHKFRLRPTAHQHMALHRCLDAHRELYNATLQERREAYGRVVRQSPAYWSAERPKGPVNYGT
jgi:transposase